MEFISFSLFPLINIIFVIHSLVYVFYTVILKLWTVPLCLWDVGPCFFVFVHVVCVCIPSNPTGACIRVWPSLPAIVVPALCLWADVSVCLCPRKCAQRSHVDVCMSMWAACAFAFCVIIVCMWQCLQLLSAKTQLLYVSVHCVQCCVQWPWAFGRCREQCRIDNSRTMAGIFCGAMGWDTNHVLTAPGVWEHITSSPNLSIILYCVQDVISYSWHVTLAN